MINVLSVFEKVGVYSASSMSIISVEASVLSTLNRLHLANQNNDRAYNPVGLVRIAIASMTVRGPLIVLVEVIRFLVVLQSEQHTF